MKKRIPLALLALGVAAACSSNNSTSTTGPNPPKDTTTTTTFHANLTGAAVRPAADTGMHGTAKATFTLKGDSMTYSVTDTAVTSKITAISINGPADSAHTGPVLQVLNAGTGTGPFAGSFTVAATDSLVTFMKSGRAYVTMADSAHTGGILRGQIVSP